jgi:hypothetical protein
MKISTHLTICIALVALQGSLMAQTIRERATSQTCRVDEAGKLVYKKDAKGNRLPDFSHVGYHAGEKVIPDVPVRMTLKPTEGDDTKRIQDALDKLGKRRQDRNGHRGALLLKRGVYRVEGALKMSHSGIVLRGEGSGPDGTIIIATGYGDYKYKRTLLSVGDEGKIQVDQSSKQAIVDDYVPVGAHTFTVKSAAKYRRGDRIVVFRPSTAEWISSIGCDKLAARWAGIRDVRWVKDGKAPGFYYQRLGYDSQCKMLQKEGESWEEFKKRVPLTKDGKKFDFTRQWEPGSYDFYFERKITAISGNKVTIDAPIVHAMEQKCGGGAIYNYGTPGRVTEVGIENLRLVSEFAAPSPEHPYGNPKRAGGAEKHAWHGIKLERNTENTWVRNVTGNYFGWSLVYARGKRATVQDCVNLGHASQISGGRRYPFVIDGQLNLMQRCVAFAGRHEFANQSRTAGPNVFVDCIGFNSKNSAGPHHRYAIGNLYDNVKSKRGMESRFRGNSGTGHGWAGTQTCFYNCVAPGFSVQAPPGGISWVLGSGKSNEEGIRLAPPSLYYQQVQDRLGKAALDRLATEDQRKQMGTYAWVEDRLKAEEISQ